MHDDIIVSYSVDFSCRKLEIHTYNFLLNRKGTIVFEDVLTHFFTGSLNVNQILDIDEWGIDDFIKENEKYLMDMKKHVWPVSYQNFQDLADYLVTKNYKYIKLISAYGMFGWVLAKKYAFFRRCL